MPSYTVKDRAVARARHLIEARQYLLDSDWGDVQPAAEEENSVLDSHVELAAHDLVQLLDETSG